MKDQNANRHGFGVLAIFFTKSSSTPTASKIKIAAIMEAMISFMPVCRSP